MIMNNIRVTKRGRPRKYKSDAERQLAYRQRRAKAEAERDRQAHYRKHRLDPNRIINETVVNLQNAFVGMGLLQSRKQAVDRARLPEWIASLKETRRDLNRLVRFLKKL